MNIPTLPTSVKNPAIHQLKPLCLAIAAVIASSYSLAGNDITIEAGSNLTNINDTGNSGWIEQFTSTDDSAVLGTTNIVDSLSNGGAYWTFIKTENAGTNSEAGNIYLNASIDYNGIGSYSGQGLELQADNNIYINSSIYDSTGADDQLNNLYMRSFNSGTVYLGGLIEANQISIGANLNIESGGVINLDNSEALYADTINKSGSGQLNFNGGYLSIQYGNLDITSSGLLGNTIELHDQKYLYANSITLGADAEVTLNGGYLSTNSLDYSAGSQIIWNSGGFYAYGTDIDVTSNGLMGADLQITADKSMSVNQLTIAADGVVNLDGGFLQANTIDTSSGGQFNWNSGSFSTINPFDITNGALLGDNVLIGSDKYLYADQITIATDGILTLDGGGLYTSAIDTSSGGTFVWNSGQFELYNTLNVTSGELLSDNVLIDSDKYLHADQITIANDGTVTLDGGGLNTNAIDTSAGGTFVWNSGNLEVSGYVNSAELLGNHFVMDSSKYLYASQLQISDGASIEQIGGDVNTDNLIIDAGGEYQHTDGYLYASTLDNSGTLNQTGGDINADVINNYGIVNHDAGSINAGQIENYATYNQNAGSLSTSGLNNYFGATLTQANATLDAGYLYNEGTVDQSGTVNAGSIDNNGTYNQNAGSISTSGLNNYSGATLTQQADTTLDADYLYNEGTVDQSGTVNVAGGTDNHGTYNQNGGTLTTDVLNNYATLDQQADATINANSFDNWNEIYSHGIINSDIQNYYTIYSDGIIGGINNDGYLTITDDGTLDITNTFTQLGGQIDFDVWTSSSDQLSAGNFDFEGGYILFNLNDITLEDFVALASIDDFLKSGGMGYLAAGFSIENLKLVSYSANGIELFINDQGRFSTSAVPVPAAAWLMGSGLIGLIGVKRRQQCLAA
jgi:hypothetical protein